MKPKNEEYEIPQIPTEPDRRTEQPPLKKG